MRRYPVLAALAPVITSPDHELAYPGDPMCLYSALAFTVQQSQRIRVGDTAGSEPYPDLCPDWGPPPSVSYRARALDDGMRRIDPPESSSDACVLDPRIWTDRTREDFRRAVRRRQPRVLLVSTVSAAHRYALEMAQIAKSEAPGCLVVFGGRHIDETVRYHHGVGVRYSYSSTVSAIADSRAPAVVDFVIGGDGAYALDLLLRAISRSMPVEQGPGSVAGTVAALHSLGHVGDRPRGTSVIVALDGPRAHAFPVVGAAYDLAELPSPYAGFAIRTRFPIFPGPHGLGRRTAHVMTSVSCPYRCAFCSESSAVTGGLRRFADDGVTHVVARVCEYVRYGAEALFFDDPVFWAGNLRSAQRFCLALREARRTGGAVLPAPAAAWLRDDADRERLAGLEWGAQFTVDLLTTVHSGETVDALLTLAHEAGCSYVYLGLESMAVTVMAGVHKNLHQNGAAWGDKVRTALRRIKAAGIRAGTSVLFGLDGETRETIEETVEGVGRLLDDDLLQLASPNILTYHPGTEITARHGMADQLDYHTMWVTNRPPYTYFEEAYPDVVSRLLGEDDIRYIYESTQRRWGLGRHGAKDVNLITEAVL